MERKIGKVCFGPLFVSILFWAPEAPFFYILHLQSVSEILCGFMVGIMCVDKQEGYGQTTVNMERKVAGNRAARRESGCGWKGMLCPFLCLYFVLCFVSSACDMMPLFLCFGVCIGPVFYGAISCVFMLSADFMRGSLLIINGFIKKSDHRRSIATRQKGRIPGVTVTVHAFISKIESSWWLNK